MKKPSEGTRYVKITRTPPIDPVHGMTLGGVFPVLCDSDTFRRAVVVRGKFKEDVTLMAHEYEFCDKDGNAL